MIGLNPGYLVKIFSTLKHSFFVSFTSFYTKVVLLLKMISDKNDSKCITVLECPVSKAINRYLRLKIKSAFFIQAIQVEPEINDTEIGLLLNS